MDSLRPKLIVAVVMTFAIHLTSVAASSSSVKRNRETVSAPSPLRIGAGESWSLQMTDAEEVTFQGVVDLDKAGLNSGQVMYPAPDPATMLVGIFVHGAIVDSQKKRQKAKIQAEADTVLAPYADILKAYTTKEMMSAALLEVTSAVPGSLIDHNTRADTRWVFVSAPLFLMTQDRKALWLQNNFTIFSPHADSAIANDVTAKRKSKTDRKSAPPELHHATIRVLADVQSADDLESHWKLDGGAVLKRESQKLFAESVTLLLRELRGELDRADAPMRTVRYVQGDEEKMERAAVIEEHCGRVVVRTLRGWIASLPVARQNDTENRCLHTSPPSEPPHSEASAIAAPSEQGQASSAQ